MNYEAVHSQPTNLKFVMKGVFIFWLYIYFCGYNSFGFLYVPYGTGVHIVHIPHTGLDSDYSEVYCEGFLQLLCCS